MNPDSEQNRLMQLYGGLRDRLLDLTRRNQLLNFSLSPRSKRFLQFVDCTLDEVYQFLAREETELQIASLPEPDEVPRDERSNEFREALNRAQVSDTEYLTAVEAMTNAGRDDEAALAKIERRLRDRVREILGLPHRPSLKEVNRVEHARILEINPRPELEASIGNSKLKKIIKLQTLKFPDELETLMEKIRGDALLAEQETGLSTLYLSFGFLRWFESDSSDKTSCAPLLLLPVQITKRTLHGRSGYSISANEAAETNLSLQKLLEVNFNRSLPNLEITEENASGSIETYLQQVRSAVEGLNRWEVHRWLVLGHFSFGRFAMYADLDPGKWGDSLLNDLVGSILRGTEQRADPNTLPALPEDYEIDEEKYERLAPYLIQDADASQHSALIDVMRGRNLVIQGPPGTGKSQTITNIIANALAANQRVLFLAEKQAALEVVKRRLDKAGLGEFCLELHSDKISSKAVIESIAKRYELGVGLRSSAASQRVDPSWNRSRQELTKYVRALHTASPDGSTAFDLIWLSLRDHTKYSKLIFAFKSVRIPPTLMQDPGLLSRVTGELAIFSDIAADYARSFGSPTESPWASLPLTEFAAYDASKILDALRELKTSVLAEEELLSSHIDFGIQSAEDFERFLDIDAENPESVNSLDLSTVASADLADLEITLNIYSDLLRVEEELAVMTDLRHEQPEKLATATSLLRVTGADVYSDLTPAQAYEKTAIKIEELKQLADTMEAILPVLTTMNLDPKLPSNYLLAVATGGFIASKTPEAQRSWLGSIPLADESSVIHKLSNWNNLKEDEASWTNKLPNYSYDTCGSAKDLRSSAITLRKNAAASIISSLNGSKKAALEIARGFGFRDPISPDQLEALADHLAAVAIFDGDTTFARQFGAAWHGLKTPIDEALAAIKIRNILHINLLKLEGGEDVLAAVLALEARSFEDLKPLGDCCRRMLALPEELKMMLTSQPVYELMHGVSKNIGVLNEFLAADPKKLLADLNIPIRRIAFASTLMTKRARINTTIEKHPTASVASILSSSAERMAKAQRLISWTRAVKASRLSDGTKSLLLKEKAEEIRCILRNGKMHWDKNAGHRSAAIATLDVFGAGMIGQKPKTEIIATVDRLLEHGEQLGQLATLSHWRRQLEALGLTDFLSQCDVQLIEPTLISGLFMALITERRATSARRVATLGSQSGSSLDALRKTFAERDIAKIKADRGTIRAKLLMPSPKVGTNLGPKKTWTDMHLLLHEFTKQQRFTPVRKLLERAGEAVQSLKPCFMMSPLSLAKYVRAGSIDFDLLVIDEASQMRPEDAIGGLLRTKQIVVVGDAKQLPPTDFFSRAEAQSGDDEDEEDIDAESILQICETTFGERRRLKWHYRSRCESLIAFSNRLFYGDTLITFPMAKPGSFSVELVRVDGVYRSRCNPDEALAIAQETLVFMREFASTPVDELPTIGIVAINLEQKDFIQEELRRLWANDELVEMYREKAEARGEPFFVKNLENVQGDERDHIFISMTYGKKPDEPHLAQHFGPIARKQGHRRLNVLFTRARVRVGLFVSFGSVDVRPTATSSDGVNALKSYLEYAETRGKAFVRNMGGEPDSDFEVEVADRLRLRGYLMVPQVGVSGFKIDLGVRHPDHPEHFLAGIECDGAAYHSSKSARDRDRLREEVLISLGWRLIRVWSTDWFDNADRETEKLVRKLEEIRSQPMNHFTRYKSLSNPEVIIENETDSNP